MASINLNSYISIGEDSIKGNFDYVNPNFKNSDKSLILGIGATSMDKLSEYGYSTEDKTFSLGTRYEQYEDVFFKPIFSVAHENLITLLTFYNPRKNSSNSIIKTNYLLRLNKFNLI